METQKTTREFYRVVTPSTFSNQNLKTLKEAKEWLADFSTGKGESADYWTIIGKQCKIEKVIEISTPIK